MKWHWYFHYCVCLKYTLIKCVHIKYCGSPLEVRHKYAVLFIQFLHYTNNISLCFADLD